MANIKGTYVIELLLKILDEGPWQYNFISEICFIKNFVHNSLDIVDFFVICMNENIAIIRQNLSQKD